MWSRCPLRRTAYSALAEGARAERRMPSTAKVFRRLRRMVFSGASEGVIFDGGGDTAFVVAERLRPAKSFQFRDAVGHDHRESGEGEHFAVIVIVADGHHLFAAESPERGPIRERRALGAGRMNDVN